MRFPEISLSQFPYLEYPSGLMQGSKITIVLSSSFLETELAAFTTHKQHNALSTCEFIAVQNSTYTKLSPISSVFIRQTSHG
jgi:hypothetical protein